MGVPVRFCDDTLQVTDLVFWVICQQGFLSDRSFSTCHTTKNALQSCCKTVLWVAENVFVICRCRFRYMEDLHYGLCKVCVSSKQKRWKNFSMGNCSTGKALGVLPSRTLVRIHSDALSHLFCHIYLPWPPPKYCHGLPQPQIQPQPVEAFPNMEPLLAKCWAHHSDCVFPGEHTHQMNALCLWIHINWTWASLWIMFSIMIQMGEGAMTWRDAMRETRVRAWQIRNKLRNSRTDSVWMCSSSQLS